MKSSNQIDTTENTPSLVQAKIIDKFREYFEDISQDLIHKNTAYRCIEKISFPKSFNEGEDND